MQFSVSSRQIVKLAAPISFSLLIPQISFMANAAFLGHLGQLELVVNGLCSIFYLLMSFIGFGLSNGIMVLMSRKAGEEDARGLSRIFSNGFFLVALGGLMLMLMSFWVSPLLFGLTIKEEPVFYTTIDFLYLRIWGLPFLMFTQLFNAFFITINRSRLLIYSALLANCLNVVLDYCLIFGHGGFEAMGLKGAAIASIASEGLGLLVVVSLFFLKRLYQAYPVLEYLYFDPKISKKTLRIAAPLIVQYVFSIGGWQVFYIYVEHLGVTQLAASHILRSVLGIVSIGTWALASTCNAMVSNLMGQGRPEQVLHLVWKIMKISFAYTLVIAAFLWLFPRLFLSAYTNDYNVVEMGLKSLRVLSCSVLVMSLATIAFNAVIGTGRTWINMTIEIACVCMYLVYVTIVVEDLRAPLQFAWASEFVYWGLLLAASGAYLYWGKWRKTII
jgi:putative MATE family efflux protein